MKTEIVYKNIDNHIDYLSFPEVGGHNVSVQIDEHIMRHLDFEIDWAKKYNIIYSNEQEVRRFCNERKNKVSIEDEVDDYEYNTKTYVMKDDNTGLYKIGRSINPKFRERTLQSEKPTIKMVKTWGEDIEKKLHKDYSEFRIRGEWFNLTKIQVRYICTHY